MLKLPNDFDWNNYIKLNPDLIDINDEKKAKIHYLKFGIHENRIYNSCLPDDFDWNSYIQLNPDINIKEENEAKIHYLKFGIHENRIYNLCLPDDFDWNSYIFLNPDLTDIKEENEAKIHYLKFGIQEKRCYKLPIYNYYNTISKINQNIIIESNDILIKKKINQIQEEKCLFNISNCSNKEKFNLICEKNTIYIKNILLPDFPKNSDFESVLIEFTCLPHLEFLIRNTILKLGEKWCHTIICGNKNYEFMKNICNSISNKINIIKIDCDFLSSKKYDLFLSSLNFWNLLNGKKILIYHENSIIFKSNIEEFLKWDYISSYFDEENNNYLFNIFNNENDPFIERNISLRTKDKMIEIINKININDTKIEKYEYITENIYFLKNMEEYNIGLLPDKLTSINFSVETILNNSFSGSSFWNYDKNWEQLIYKYNIIKFNYPIETYSDLNEYYENWKLIKNNLLNNNLFSICYNKHFFFDKLEEIFLFDNTFYFDKKWSGIFHLTPNTPNYLNDLNINNIFKNFNFINSLKFCEFIITFSNYLSNYLIKKFNEINLKIKVYTLKYPINDNVTLFNYNDFENNNEKKIIQVGHHLRKLTSIFLLKEITNYKKLLLPGNKDFDKIKSLINDEIKFLNIDSKYIDYNNIEMFYVNKKKYNDLLSKNIIFIDLYDSTANNTIVECIIRNTPILVNKIEGVIDYLGDNYPLYFNNLEEIPDLIKNENILKAHEYLLNMNKKDLQIDYFTNNLMTILYKNFVNK